MIWGVEHDSEETFIDSILDVMHRMMNHAMVFFFLNHRMSSEYSV